MSKTLREAQAALYGSCRFADCTIVFWLEAQCGERQDIDAEKELYEALPAEEGRDVSSAPAGTSTAVRDAAIHYLGEPLPAHRSIVCLASGFLSARLESWQAAMEDGAQGDSNTPRTSERPPVLVALGSEAELPHALEVIRFMYTGQLTEGLGFEALLHVRRLAGYLEVADCPAACDTAMLAWVNNAEAAGSGGGSADSSTRSASSGSRVVEAYRHHALFPDPETAVDPTSFDPVLQALGRQLVPCLKDAVSVYTDPQLQQQWCALPACAVEAVLADDSFPTDDESTVLLLLACWLRHQSPPADPATTERLCRLIRASRLSPTYASLVLPHLEWFPAAKADLALIQLLVNAPDEAHRDRVQQHAKKLHPVWAKGPRRQQLVPKAARTLHWCAAKQALVGAMQGKGASDNWVNVPLQLSGQGVTADGGAVVSCGLMLSFKVFAAHDAGTTSAAPAPTSSAAAAAGPSANPTASAAASSHLAKLKPPLVLRALSSAPKELGVPLCYALSLNLSYTLSQWVGGAQGVAWSGPAAREVLGGNSDTHTIVIGASVAAADPPLAALAPYFNHDEMSGTITVRAA